MAAKTQGTAHIHGTGGTNGNGFTLTNATIVAVSLTPAFERNLTTENEAGVVIETRRDSRSYKGTIEVFIRSGYTIPTLGDIVTVSGLSDNALNRIYEIVSTPQSYQSGEKVRVTLTLEAHEGITYTA
jgi:hypothetical protein